PDTTPPPPPPSVLRPIHTALPPLPEDREEQVPQPPERAELRQIELDARVRGTAPAPSARPSPRAAVTARPGEGPILAELIVLFPLRGVAEHVVRFVDLLEALSCLWFAGIAVRMVLLGQPSHGALAPF